jgi:Ca2+-binding RTX toxin-like protein
MGGGLGNDTYLVDNLGDAVYENPNEGTDAVWVSVSGYTLSANVEIGVVNSTTGLTLYGSDQSDILFGNIGDDVLIGGGGNDQFAAGAGNDVIDGGVGTDAMGGGLGNDTYVVDNLGDAVYENPNEGTDAVWVSVSGYTLSANVEIGVVITTTGLTLTGSDQSDILFGNIGDDVLIGGGGNDQFAAGLGNDTIDGGTGNDAMTGGAGDDTFVFSAAGFGNDTISDFNPAEDVLQFSPSLFVNFQEARANAQDVAGGTVITNGADTVMLANIAVSSLNQTNVQIG